MSYWRHLRKRTIQLFCNKIEEISVTNDDISLLSYHLPERKDRVADSHGGVIIYIKDHIHYVRRNDLEPIGVECVWVELTLKHKHILFGPF